MAGVFLFEEDKKRKEIHWKQNRGEGPWTSGAKRPKGG